MNKRNRTKLKHDFLVCFVPVHSVKENGIVHWLAPFLDPLVRETEEAFVKGNPAALGLHHCSWLEGD
jgi:hypothetical protein